MQENGARNRFVGVLEKIYLYSYALLTLISVVNIAVICITKKQIIFFLSKFFLLYPLLQDNDTAQAQLKNGLLLLFLLSIDGLFFIMIKKEFNDTSPGFHGVWEMGLAAWCVFCLVWQAICIDTSDPYPVFGNGVFAFFYYMFFS